MKKLLTLGFIGIITISSYAQSGEPDRDPEARAQKMTEQMQKNLQLSEEQVPEVYQINLSMANAMHAKEQEKRSIKENHRVQLSEVLTDDQLATLDNLMAKRKQMRKGKHTREEMAPEKSAVD